MSGVEGHYSHQSPAEVSALRESHYADLERIQGHLFRLCEAVEPIERIPGDKAKQLASLLNSKISRLDGEVEFLTYAIGLLDQHLAGHNWFAASFGECACPICLSTRKAWQ